MIQRKPVTGIILFYLFFFLIIIILGVALLNLYGPDCLLPVLVTWILAAIFLGGKLYLRLRYRSAYRKGDWDIRELDGISGMDFETLTCDILAANGFDIAENTQASRDFGVDVLARRDGISYAIQCKRYKGAVGIEAVQQVYAGRAYYDCHVAVVLTNQYFTSNARKLADKLGVLLWDRDVLEEML